MSVVNGAAKRAPRGEISMRGVGRRCVSDICARFSIVTRGLKQKPVFLPFHLFQQVLARLKRFGPL